MAGTPLLRHPLEPVTNREKATWRSGYAAVCKTVYPGSIPGVASRHRICRRHSAGVAEMDFTLARRMMVDGQVRTSDVTDPDLIAAMAAVPRERFVAPAKSAIAYLDLDVPVSEGSDPRASRRLPQTTSRALG